MKPVFFSAPERCVSRDDALVGRLVELWEASVRATHDFLSDNFRHNTAVKRVNINL